jgi:hypothetical protein
MFCLMIFAATSTRGAEGGKAELISVRKIWDAAPHNAFTDLIYFHGQWICVFREGAAHVSPDGAIRMLVSTNGDAWSSLAKLTSPGYDLRDPKITVTPDGLLMLTTAGAQRSEKKTTHQSFAWFSEDGGKWSQPAKIGDENMWLWRVTWSGLDAYSIGYDTIGGKLVRLYTSKDGRNFTTLVPTLFDHGEPNESALVFLATGTAYCLLRRDGEPGSAQFGIANRPYRKWTWKDLGTRIGGPNMIRLDSGELIGAGRLYDGKVRTSIFAINPVNAELKELLSLPSGGDSSYPGLVWRHEMLYVSYYSSHEGRTAIYFAQVRLQKK